MALAKASCSSPATSALGKERFCQGDFWMPAVLSRVLLRNSLDFWGSPQVLEVRLWPVRVLPGTPVVRPRQVKARRVRQVCIPGWMIYDWTPQGLTKCNPLAFLLLYLLLLK